MTNWASIAKTFRQAVEANGSTAAVTLRDGTHFTCAVACGRTRTSDLTQGIEQQRDRCIVPWDEWHDNAPRAPEKGDQLLVNGRRYAIESVKDHVQNDTGMAYRFMLEG